MYLAAESDLATILGQISEVNPQLLIVDSVQTVTSADVGEDEPRGSGGWWDWHPSKTALEYLWRSGTLSVARREGFRKVYDLSDKVIPDDRGDFFENF